MGDQLPSPSGSRAPVKVVYRLRMVSSSNWPPEPKRSNVFLIRGYSLRKHYLLLIRGYSLRLGYLGKATLYYRGYIVLQRPRLWSPLLVVVGVCGNCLMDSRVAAQGA